MGEWSFGDLAGHLLGWRDRTIARLEAAARGEPDPIIVEPDTDDEVDAANVEIRDAQAGRTAAELVAAYDESYDRLIRALDALPEERLTTPKAFEWAGDEPLVTVAFTGHLHEEHVPAVRAWLEGR